MTLEEVASGHFIRLFPEFEAEWAAEELFREEDGTHTLCGLFCAVSTFLRERATLLTEEQRRSFGEYVNDYFHWNDTTQGVLGACLIENLEGYDFTPLLFEYVAPEVLRQFQVQL